jgi:hypothetical protein
MMEELFTSPYKDLKDLFEGGWDDFTEVDLIVPVEEFLVYRWDWKDLQAFVTGDFLYKIVWITDVAFIAVEDNKNDVDFRDAALGGRISADIQATSGQEQKLTLAYMASEGTVEDKEIPESTREVSVFWRAIMTSNSAKLSIETNGLLGLPSGPFLSQFLQGSPFLQVLDFWGFDFDEEHCRALVNLQRTDLKVTLSEGTIEPHNAENTFIEWFRHNKIVTELHSCDVESSFLSALSGNNSVKKLSFMYMAEEKIRSLAHALTGNMGIQHLTSDLLDVSDETWSLFFRSISRHPRVEVLDLALHRSVYERRQPLSTETMTKRMNAVLQMLQHNTVVHTIDLAEHFRDVEMYQNAIIPRLEMNRSCFEVQRRAVKRADPAIRPQLLGRVLYVVRYNPNLVFLFLSENVPAFIRAEEE